MIGSPVRRATSSKIGRRLGRRRPPTGKHPGAPRHLSGLSYENMDTNLTVSSTSRPGRRRRARRTPKGAVSTAAMGASVATAAKPRADELREARPTPQITDELALKLAIALGISPLNRPPICHGYGNECSCEECCARAQQLGRRAVEVRQPWDAAA
jgi:hypothetical protein